MPAPVMRKDELMETVRNELRSRLERLQRAAAEARAAATDPGSKAESKYDTRSLEASYLASGQARQAQDLVDSLRILETYQPEDFDMDSAVDAGALVEVDLAGEASYFLLVPAGGGLSVDHDGREITLLSPASALYQKLTGKRIGDTFGDPPMLVTEAW